MNNKTKSLFTGIAIVCALFGVIFTGCQEKSDNMAPIADFTYSSDLEELMWLNFSFIDNSSDPDGEIIKWEWDFDDYSEPSEEQNPFHHYTPSVNYNQTRIHNVTLTVTDNNNLTNSITKPIIIDFRKRFSYNPSKNNKINNIINFTFTPTEDDGTILNTYWDFDDGSSSSVENPSHLYTSSGEYIVILTFGYEKNGVVGEKTSKNIVRIGEDYPPLGFKHSPILSEQYNRSRFRYNINSMSIIPESWKGWHACVKDDQIKIYQKGYGLFEIYFYFKYNFTLDERGVIIDENWVYNQSLSEKYRTRYGEAGPIPQYIYCGDSNEEIVEIRLYRINTGDEYTTLQSIGYWDGTEFHLFGF